MELDSGLYSVPAETGSTPVSSTIPWNQNIQKHIESHGGVMHGKKYCRN